MKKTRAANADATTFLYTQDMTSVVRKEVRTPERFRGHVLVDGGTYGGMPMEMYEKCIYIRKSRSKNRPGPGTYKTDYVYYMTEEAYGMFPTIIHRDTPRNMNGKPTNPKIAIKETLALSGILACELCGKKYDETKSGATVFKIDSTTDEEPSSTARRSVPFLLDKIARGAAQIICSDCEYTKTCLAKPFAQGSSRSLAQGSMRPRKRAHVLDEEDDE